MPTTTPFAIHAELTRALERDGSAGSPTAFTIRALLRHDFGRLEFWGGDQVVRDAALERLWVVGDEERVCLEAASRDAELTACVGFVKTPSHRPVASAWLVDTDGAVIDVAAQRREALGLLGVRLRSTEVASWVPSDTRSIAHRDVHRLAV